MCLYTQFYVYGHWSEMELWHQSAMLCMFYECSLHVNLPDTSPHERVDLSDGFRVPRVVNIHSIDFTTLMWHTHSIFVYVE